MPFANQISLKLKQEEVVEFISKAIGNGEAGADDINVIIHFHQSALDEDTSQSLAEYQTRTWILKNILLILDSKYIDTDICPEIERELSQIDWVISSLVYLDTIFNNKLLCKKNRRRQFAIQLKKIMRAEMYLGNKAIDSQVDLAETVNLIKETETLC